MLLISYILIKFDSNRNASIGFLGLGRLQNFT